MFLLKEKSLIIYNLLQLLAKKATEMKEIKELLTKRRSKEMNGKTLNVPGFKCI